MNSVLSVSSRSWVDRAPARCLGGHGFDSCRGSRIFPVPRPCHVEYFIFQTRSFCPWPVFWNLSTFGLAFIHPMHIFIFFLEGHKFISYYNYSVPPSLNKVYYYSWAISALSVVVATSFQGRFPWLGDGAGKGWLWCMTQIGFCLLF